MITKNILLTLTNNYLYYFNIYIFQYNKIDIFQALRRCVLLFDSEIKKSRKCTRNMQFSVANFKSKVGCIDFSFNIIQFSFNTFSYNLALITWSIILNFKSPLQSLKNIFIWIDQMMRLLLHMVFLKMKKLKHSFFIHLSSFLCFELYLNTWKKEIYSFICYYKKEKEAFLKYFLFKVFCCFLQTACQNKCISDTNSKLLLCFGQAKCIGEGVSYARKIQVPFCFTHLLTGILHFVVFWTLCFYGLILWTCLIFGCDDPNYNPSHAH